MPTTSLKMEKSFLFFLLIFCSSICLNDAVRPRRPFLIQQLLTNKHPPVAATGLNALSSTEITNEIKFDEEKWVKIDEYFPKIQFDDQYQLENAEHDSRRFFYAFGKYPSTSHKLNNETIQRLRKDYENKPFNKIYHHFKLWYNKSPDKCTRSFYVYPETNEIALDKPNEWNDKEFETSIINSEDLENFIENFELYLSALDNCEKSILAIKELIFSYDKVSSITDGNHIEKTESVIELKRKEFGDEYEEGYLYLYGCQKEKSCSFEFEFKDVKVEKDKELFRYKSESEVKIDGVSPHVDENGWWVVTTEKPKEKLIINFKSDQLIVFDFKKAEQGRPKVIKGNHFVLDGTTKNWIDNQNADDDEIVFWPKENSETTDSIKLDSDAMTKCFEISYKPAQIENLKIILKSNIYFYQLYEHHPTSDELPDEAIKFCTSDLFHPHSDNANVEVFLQITKNHEEKDVVTISIKKEESPNNENTRIPMFFPAYKIPKENEIEEEMDVWSKTSFPMLKDMASSGPILGLVESSQPFNVFTNWLNMFKNDMLFSKPMLLEFVSSGKFTLKAFLCDSTSICVQAKHVELKSEDVQENKSQYKILFDPHPNQNSSTVRVQLEITPQDEEIKMEIKMLNFGNPCRPKPICEEKSPNYRCEEYSGESWHPANNFEKACECDSSKYDGVNCDIENKCSEYPDECGNGKDVECLNLKEGPKCQCTNGLDAIKIFNKSIKKCESLNPKKIKDPKKIIYTLDIEKINLDIYDVCVQFPRSEDFTEFKLDINVNGDVQIIKDLKIAKDFKIGDDKTGFGKLCLIFPLQLQSSLKPNDWIKNMTVQCTPESKMNSEPNWIPKFSNPPRDPAFAIRSIRNKKDFYCFGLDNLDYDDKDKELVIPKGAKNGSQIWLSTKWFENLSDEYKDEKSRNDFISLKFDDDYTERSEICFSNKKKCDEFKTKEDLVRKLQENKNNFRLQWIFNVNKKPEDTIRIPLEISFFDPCFHDCNRKGECMILDNRHFRCKCDDSHSGEKCQFPAKCSKTQEDVCRNIHGERKYCKKLSETKYTCQCPQGYEFNQEKEECGRVKIEKVKNICGTRLNNDGDDSSPEECFLHKITDQMNYLPKNFPEIEFELENNDELYYTMTSETVFKIDQIKNEKDSNWKNSSNTDICLKFRYFLTGNDATLSIQLNDDHESIMDIKGVELLKQNSPNNIGDVAKSMDNMKFLNHEQEICLRTLVGKDKINDLKSISFVPKFPDHSGSSEDLILLQLIPFRNKNMMIWTENTKTYLSSEPLPFIGKTSDDLKLLTGSEEMSEQDINIQKWPVHFPLQRFINMETVKDHTGKVSVKSLKTGTKEFAQIETQWLRRAIDENSAAAILGFELGGKSEDYLKQIEIEIIDDQRKQLKNLGKFTTDDWKGHLEIKDDISNETIYKIVMKFQYEDPIDGNTGDVLFQVENFNFGDPCINASNGEEQPCYNIKNEPDPAIKCQRIIEEDRNKIDYQCNCNFTAGSKGKNCEGKNYCKYKHLQIMEEKKEVNITGEEYCKSDKKLAQCLEGEFENTNTNTKYNFLCECTDSKLWFEMKKRECVPIGKCLLHPPIDLDGKTCQDKDGRCDCECNPGYEKSEENDDKTSFKCVPKKTCEDGECPEGMTCLKQGDVAICKCPKGFKRDKEECKPDVCRFPEMNPCEQTCSNEDIDPYFQCHCESEYYTKEKNSCKLKNDVPEPCKNCQGLGKVCLKGQCGCLSGFEYRKSPDGSINCVPKEEELKLACPDNKLKIDNTTGKIGCDCTDNEMQKWWMAQGNGTCTLEKTACDKGEIGDETCKNAGGLCLIDPEEPYGYNCFCSNGMIFPDGKIEKSSAEIVENKKIQCMPACEIPYYERQCSAFGAKCNPVKLYEKLIDQTKQSQEFCDCIPGTFRGKGQSVCNQHKNVLAMKMVHTWTTELQKSFEKKWSDLETLSPLNKYTNLNSTKSKQLEYVDPLNYGLAQQRSLKIIQERMAENKLQQTMKLLIKMDILRQQTRTMMRNFQLIEDPLNLDVVNLVVNSEEPNQYLLDVYLYDLNNFGMVANDSDVIAQHVRCAKIESDDMCIIPYMQITIIKDSLRSESFEPCSNKSVDVCMGKSDCRQNKINNGLYFSCECNQTFFDVEERTTFKTDEPLVVMKNERCQSKNLCEKYNCVGDNQECVEKDPTPDPNQSWRWIKEIECGCQSGYRRNEQSQLCEAVCNDYICHSGTCKNVGHDGYLCECDADHYGEHCENEHPSNTKWIVPIVILVLLVIGISGAFAYMQKKSSKQSINNNNNNNNHDNNNSNSNSDHQQRSSLRTSTSTSFKFETLRPSGKNKKVQQINFGYSPSLESISEQSKHHQVTIFDPSNVQSSSSSSSPSSGHPDHQHQDVIQLDSLKSFTSSSSCTSSSFSSASKSCSSSLHGQNNRSEMLTKKVVNEGYYQELNPINKEKSIVNNQPLIARILNERIGMAETTKVVPTSSIELQPLKAQYSKPFKSSSISSSLKTTTTTTTTTTTSQSSILRSKPIETITIPGNHHHHQSIQPAQHSPSSSASPTADQNQISLNPITSLVVPNNDYHHHHHPSQASIIIEPQSTERPKSISEFGKQVASIALRKNHRSYDVLKKQQQNET